VNTITYIVLYATSGSPIAIHYDVAVTIRHIRKKCSGNEALIGSHFALPMILCDPQGRFRYLKPFKNRTSRKRNNIIAMRLPTDG